MRFDAMNLVEIYEHLGGKYCVHQGVEGLATWENLAYRGTGGR
jgi:hypothetical protein